jgi:hypothetical protein
MGDKPRIPDYLSPWVGWKAWRLRSDGVLVSPVQPTEWRAGEALVAECRCGGDCRNLCGIYACRTWPLLLQRGYPAERLIVVGEVFLWGWIKEHTDGFRAQKAYPKSLNVVLQNEPLSLLEVQDRVMRMGVYGADVGVYNGKVFLPLLDRGGQWHDAGVEVILKCRANWLELLKTPELRLGSKVFINGQITFVDKIDGEQVVLHKHCRRERYFAPRKEINWDRNLRAFIRNRPGATNAQH